MTTSARATSRAFCTALCVALLSGCAGADSEVLYSANLASLQPPPVLVVDTFSFQADTVTVDKSGPEFTSGKGSHTERQDLGRSVSEALATKIVAHAGEVGIEARRAQVGVEPPPNALVLKGQFIEIDEGDQMARVTVGFGAGTEELRVRIQLYQVAEDGGLRRVREGLGSAHGDKMPGVAVPVGVGAAAGNVAVSAAVSGGLNVASELNTGMDSAAENLAKTLAERAQKTYDDHGWPRNEPTESSD